MKGKLVAFIQLSLLCIVKFGFFLLPPPLHYLHSRVSNFAYNFQYQSVSWNVKMATNQTKKLPNFRFEIQGDAEFKKSIQVRMQTVKNVLTAARNKPATNSLINNELLTFQIENRDNTARNDRNNVFPPSYFRPRRRTQISKFLLQQNHQFPIYANILNFVKGRLQF